MKKVLISKKELKKLLLKEEELNRLEVLGVDNWVGYGDQNSTEWFEETLDDFEDWLDGYIDDNYNKGI